MSRRGYGLEEAGQFLNTATGMLRLGEAAGAITDRNVERARQREQDQILMQYVGGERGADDPIENPTQLAAYGLYRDEQSRDMDFKEKQRLFDQSVRNREKLDHYTQQISSGPQSMMGASVHDFQTFDDAQAFALAASQFVKNSELSNAMQQVREQELAKLYNNFEVGKKEVMELLQRGDEHSRHIAAEEIEQWSEILNTDNQYEHLGNGQMRVHKLNRNTTEYEPTDVVLPLEQVAKGMVETKPQQFIRHQIAMAQTIIQENEHSWIEPMRMVDGNNVAHDVVIEVDPDDAKTQTAYVYRQGGGLAGVFKSSTGNVLHEVRGSGLTETKPAKEAADVREVDSEVNKNYAGIKKTQAETAEIWGEVQGGGGGDGAAKPTFDGANFKRLVDMLIKTTGSSDLFLDDEGAPTANTISTLKEMVSDQSQDPQVRQWAAEALQIYDAHMGSLFEGAGGQRQTDEERLSLALGNAGAAQTGDEIKAILQSLPPHLQGAFVQELKKMRGGGQRQTPPTSPEPTPQPAPVGGLGDDFRFYENTPTPSPQSQPAPPPAPPQPAMTRYEGQQRMAEARQRELESGERMPVEAGPQRQAPPTAEQNPDVPNRILDPRDQRRIGNYRKSVGEVSAIVNTPDGMVIRYVSGYEQPIQSASRTRDGYVNIVFLDGSTTALQDIPVIQ